MKKKISSGAILLMFIIGMFFFCLVADAEKPHEQEAETDSFFDTSIVESNWCGEPTDGTIRMVGAWVIADDNGLYTLEDETGNLWEVADVAIAEDDFLLLWIADCKTPEVEDDLILKCWAEVH